MAGAGSQCTILVLRHSLKQGEEHIDLTYGKAASVLELPAVRDRPIQSRLN